MCVVLMWIDYSRLCFDFGRHMVAHGGTWRHMACTWRHMACTCPEFEHSSPPELFGRPEQASMSARHHLLCAGSIDAFAIAYLVMPPLLTNFRQWKNSVRGRSAVLLPTTEQVFANVLSMCQESATLCPSHFTFEYLEKHRMLSIFVLCCQQAA